MTEIRVPTLGESVTEATIGRWFKKAGDAVAVDEPLVELETDKVTIEVPAPSAGTLSEIAAKDGETVAVGALLGQIKDGAAAAARPRRRGRGAASQGSQPGRRHPRQLRRQPRRRQPMRRWRRRCASFGRKRHRCLDRSRLRQGWPGDQGRHAGRDREGGLGADAGQSAGRLGAGRAAPRPPTMPRAKSA